MENQEKYLSTGQLMEFLEISRSTVYRLMAKGMPNIMIGSVHRFPRADACNRPTEPTLLGSVSLSDCY